MKIISLNEVKVRLEPLRAVTELLEDLISAEHFEAAALAAKKVSVEIRQFEANLDEISEEEDKPEEEEEEVVVAEDQAKKENPPVEKKPEPAKPAPAPKAPAESAV